MKKVFFVCGVILLMAAAASARPADTYVYPSENPRFSISFPDSWHVESDEQVLHASPDDESLYMAIWALEEAEDLEDALDGLEEAVSGYIEELEFGEAEETEVNGIPLVFIEGSGFSDDVEVNVSCAVFIPDEEQVFILLYFGTDEAEEIHSGGLESIVRSIKRQK